MEGTVQRVSTWKTPWAFHRSTPTIQNTKITQSDQPVNELPA